MQVKAFRPNDSVLRRAANFGLSYIKAFVRSQVPKYECLAAALLQGVACEFPRNGHRTLTKWIRVEFSPWSPEIQDAMKMESYSFLSLTLNSFGCQI